MFCDEDFPPEKWGLELTPLGTAVASDSTAMMPSELTGAEGMKFGVCAERASLLRTLTSGVECPSSGLKVRSGCLNNCFLIAAIAAVLERSPQTIADLFLGDPQCPKGRYDCRFFMNGRWRRVTIDDRIVVLCRRDNERPMSSTPAPQPRAGLLPFAHAEARVLMPTSIADCGEGLDLTGDSAGCGVTGLPPFWLPLLEKAYAKAMGHYGKFGVGGEMSEAILHLTGFGCTVLPTLSTHVLDTIDVELLHKQLLGCFFDSTEPAGAQTNQEDATMRELPQPDSDSQFLRELVVKTNMNEESRRIPTAERGAARESEASIDSGHAYVVVDVSRVGDGIRQPTTQPALLVTVRDTRSVGGSVPTAYLWRTFVQRFNRVCIFSEVGVKVCFRREVRVAQALPAHEPCVSERTYIPETDKAKGHVGARALPETFRCTSRPKVNLVETSRSGLPQTTSGSTQKQAHPWVPAVPSICSPALHHPCITSGDCENSCALSHKNPVSLRHNHRVPSLQGWKSALPREVLVRGNCTRWSFCGIFSPGGAFGAPGSGDWFRSSPFALDVAFPTDTEEDTVLLHIVLSIESSCTSSSGSNSSHRSDMRGTTKPAQCYSLPPVGVSVVRSRELSEIDAQKGSLEEGDENPDGVHHLAPPLTLDRYRVIAHSPFSTGHVVSLDVRLNRNMWGCRKIPLLIVPCVRSAPSATAHFSLTVTVAFENCTSFTKRTDYTASRAVPKLVTQKKESGKSFPFPVSARSHGSVAVAPLCWQCVTPAARFVASVNGQWTVATSGGRLIPRSRNIGDAGGGSPASKRTATAAESNTTPSALSQHVIARHAEFESNPMWILSFQNNSECGGGIEQSQEAMCTVALHCKQDGDGKDVSSCRMGTKTGVYLFKAGRQGSSLFSPKVANSTDKCKSETAPTRGMQCGSRRTIAAFTIGSSSSPSASLHLSLSRNTGSPQRCLATKFPSAARCAQQRPNGMSSRSHALSPTSGHIASQLELRPTQKDAVGGRFRFSDVACKSRGPLPIRFEDGPFVVVPCTYEAGGLGRFTLSVWASVPVELTRVSNLLHARSFAALTNSRKRSPRIHSHGFTRSTPRVTAESRARGDIRGRTLWPS
eukprot:INCI14107.2.p1 GENE.INCI14107.2~~INCI14107.2.p1  ORF type:complete len:1109 (+),score=95.61 INCI14107.2:238-3564(+)